MTGNCSATNRCSSTVISNGSTSLVNLSHFWHFFQGFPRIRNRNHYICYWNRHFLLGALFDKCELQRNKQNRYSLITCMSVSVLERQTPSYWSSEVAVSSLERTLLKCKLAVFFVPDSIVSTIESLCLTSISDADWSEYLQHVYEKQKFRNESPLHRFLCKASARCSFCGLPFYVFQNLLHVLA